MQANTFMVLPSYVKAVGELPAKDRGELWRAIIEYATQGVQPALRLASQRAIFAAIKPSLDYNMSRRKPQNAGETQTSREQNVGRMQAECRQKDGTPSKEIRNKKEEEEEKEKNIKEKETRQDVIPMPARAPVEEKPVRAWFDRLWAIFPKKTARYPAEAALAEHAWEITEADVSRMEAMIKKAAASQDWTKEGGRYCPRMDRWLSSKPWLDGDAAVPSQQQGRALSPQEKAAIEELMREGGST